MKVTFERKKLSAVLQFVKNSIPKKEIEPVLNSLYFKTLDDTNEVQIISTDLDLMAVARCEATIETPGAMTILGEKLLILVSRLTGEKISFDCDGKSIAIECGTYKADFKTLGTDDYPEVYKITEKESYTSFEREQILSGLRRIDFAVNEDEARKNLMAVQISKNGMVASNGKITAIYKEKFDVEELCISSNCLKDLIAVMNASSAQKIEVFEEEAYLVFKFNNDLFFTRKTSVKFPEVFEKFDAPTERSNKELLTFKVKDLKQTIQRISLTASEATKSVVFEVVTDDEMKVSAKDTKDFSSEELIKFKSDNLKTSVDKPFVLILNYQLLLEVLGKMAGEDITFKMNIENVRSPLRIEEGKTVMLMMRSLV